jgi:hypothetical protein
MQDPANRHLADRALTNGDVRQRAVILQWRSSVTAPKARVSAASEHRLAPA